MSAPELSAAVLVGGQGRRLGGAKKPLLEVGGATILSRQLAVLETRVGAVAVVAPDPSPYVGFDVELVSDSGDGPLAGIAAAVAWSPGEWLLVVAGDMPFISVHAIDALVDRRLGFDVIAPVVGGRTQPLFALYNRSSLDVIARRLHDGRRSPSALFEAAGADGLRARLVDSSEIEGARGEPSFAAGINTAGDLERARAFARGDSPE